ncbi:hypothetical protein G9H61_04045 [Aquirufa ecclesiirivi]|uniref:Uncharacterized protein n=1 Tax=Aquirufa ecclesiirivi TaxID=2715124 RepID=A0ABT4JE88_9BACT|nr:hypothetical protein [Aquirufa ecclesiirivi]
MIFHLIHAASHDEKSSNLFQKIFARTTGDIGKSYDKYDSIVRRIIFNLIKNTE